MLGILNDTVAGQALSQGVAVGANSGYNASYTAPMLIKLLINSLLSFLGILLMIYILMAGYKWFSARGDEKAVGEAKKSISTAVVGMVIILSAYAITAFVFSKLDSVVNSAG